ncbi:PAS domain S-box protein [Rubrobacter tropicus]|uniref:histidine kinase n=1 Tax=Rubrobacter tropicus TaxID=2653851 RepID=A0A6G8Q747_9ACTN|nr:PAS domain S-box protein [Rubrobacter tropicus]QIN82147.1 PAS domain S-box protein [Rubrobacter tropicus]
MRIPTALRRLAAEGTRALRGGPGVIWKTLARQRLEEERLRLLAENSRDVVYRYRFVPEPGYDYVSPSCTAMTGYTPEEHYADPGLVTKLVYPEGRHPIEASARSPKEPLVMRWRRKDGALIWVEQRNKPVYDRAGDVVAVEGVARDVTESRRVEAALRESEALARFTIDSLSAHIAILDSSGGIVAVNRAWTDFAGDAPGADSRGVGANYLRVCDSATARGCGEAARFAGGIRGVISGRETYFEMEYPCHTPEGRRWFVGRVTPFPGAGEPRVVVAHEDTTERKLAEEAIRESEERLDAILQNTSAVVYLMSPESRFVHINRCFEELFGLNNFEVRGKSVYDVFPAEVAASFESNNRRVLAESAPVEFEEFAPHSDGMHVYSSIKAPLFDAAGKPRGIVGISTDITRRKQAEQALRESEERFRAAFDSAAAGMALTSPEGRWLQVNRSMCEITGYAEEELIGTDFQSITHPEDLREDLEGMGRLLSGEARYHYGEKRFLHKDGHPVWVFLSASLVRDAAGEPLYFVAQVQDITGSKRDKEILQKLSRQNEMILASAGEGIYGLDIREMTTFANPAAEKMLGYEAGELVGRHQHVIIRHSTPGAAPYPPEECPVYAALRDGEVHVSSDEVFWRKDGTSFPVEFVSTPIVEGGEVVGAVVTFSDITERKRAEEALAEAARAKTEFLAEVSHELRTPLTVIRGNAEVGLDLGRDCEHGEILAEIVKESSTMSRMVEELLFLARSESSAPPFRMEPVPVKALLNSLAKRAASVAAGHGATLAVSPFGDGIVRADPTRVEQAVLALVENAGKYGPEGQTITLDSAIEGGELRVQVRDRGPGIPEADLPHVFERFYRASDVGEPGNGLGLSIARTIVQAHGGRIEVESKTGQGTQVCVSLPLLTAPD